MLLAATEGTVLLVWGFSLALGAVVLVVVAALLWLIRHTAADIETGAEAIWTVGKMVANNTIQIPLFLGTANRVVGAIGAAAPSIVKAAAAIEQHAEGCPGCPHCVLPPRS